MDGGREALQATFWICIALIVYHCVLYPLLILVWARAVRAARKAIPGAQVPFSSLPTATIIVPAYNEARFIACKVENLAQLRYPAGKLTVVIALDGCADDTAARAREAIARSPDPGRFVLRDFTRNRGKVAVLNQEVRQAATEVVALTDCSATVGPDALVRLAGHFGAPDVGVVCPAYATRRGADGGEASYWSYQTAIKAAESVIAAPIGPHGAFYLFRRALWRPLSPETINDDFVLPMRMVADGARAIYDPNVVATELERPSRQHDFRRRIRLGAGNVQQVAMLWSLADPRRGALAFLFLSGKAMRAFLPLVVILAMLASLGAMLSGSPLFRGIVAMELVLLSAVPLARLLGPERTPGFIETAGYGIRALTASALGACLYVLGSGGQVWRLSNIAKHRFNDH